MVVEKLCFKNDIIIDESDEYVPAGNIDDSSDDDIDLPEDSDSDLGKLATNCYSKFCCLSLMYSCIKICMVWFMLSPRFLRVESSWPDALVIGILSWQVGQNKSLFKEILKKMSKI